MRVGVDIGGPELRRRIADLLRGRGFEVVRVSAADAGVDACLVELPRGARLLDELLRRQPSPALVALCPPGGTELAVQALEAGVDEFALAPLDLEELRIKLERALSGRRPALDPAPDAGRQPSAAGPPPELTGRSAALRAARRHIERAAAGTATVLLSGETGTGKEVAATTIHRLSPRAARSLVAVNCAALPEPLLESELFGHERGAFTGAQQRRTGRFEDAHGGTLFLDEVGDMQPRTQAKVLRVLQEREFERLGGSRPIRVDVRIVAATNQDLAALIRRGTFREDLFYRLNVVPVLLPPLRERREDIPLLAEVFREDFNRSALVPKRGLSRGALELLCRRSWPGNVRELRNAIEHAVLMGSGDWIEPGDLPAPAAARAAAAPGDTGPGLVRLPAQGVDLVEVERELVVQALERSGWVQKEAAQLLSMSRRKLNYRIRRLGITHPRWRRNRGVAAGSS